MASRVPYLLQDLLTPLSKASALETVLATFRSLGFKVTSWQSGGIGLTVANFLADMVAQQSGVIVNAVRSGFLDYAEGRWLTLLAKSLFDETRIPAVKTVGTMRLSSSAGAPPYTVAPFSKWIQNGSGLKFVNSSGGTLASGAGQVLDLTWEAEGFGSAYNLANNTALSFVTPMAGVTISNPPGTSGDWITTHGLDEESDASLVSRCRAKWATISYGTPALAYEYWARAASSEVTRVWVDSSNPVGPGTIIVYVAGASGGITSPTTLATVDTYLQARKAFGSLVGVYGAETYPQPVEGTVYCRGISIAEAQAKVEAAVQAWVQSIPIGGETFGGGSGYIYLNGLVTAIRSVPGIAHVVLTDPTSDVLLMSTQVPTATFALSYALV